jgi:hypothetical protein
MNTARVLGTGVAVLVWVLELAAASSARAQGNDLSVPMGGRSALMGNTGVALARDGSAPFLNPATIVRIADNSLAFSVNFYSFSSTTLGGWHEPSPPDTSHFGDVALRGKSVGTNGFRVLPSTLCLFFTIKGVTDQGSNGQGFHRGRQKLAVCFGSTEYEDIVMPALPFLGSTPLGMTSQTQSVSRNWTRFNVGPTYGISLSDSFALGVSLQGAYTEESFSIDSSSITSTSGGDAVQSSLAAGGSAYSFDFVAIVGAAYRVGKITLGASAELPALHAFGKYAATLNNQYGIAGVDTAMLSGGSGSFSAPPPMRFALGAGAEWPRLAVELDGSLQVPVAPISSTLNGWTTSLMGTTASTTSFRAAYSVPERPAWNAGLGAEFFVTKNFSLIGGTSTSLTTLPALSPTMSLGNIVQGRTSSATVSFGLGSYGGGSDLLVGAQLGYAWGQMMAVNPYALPNDWAVVGTHSYSAMLILAGATDLRNIGRAAGRVQRAVSGDPEPKPTPLPAPAGGGTTLPERAPPRSGGLDPRGEVPETPKPPTAPAPAPTPAPAPSPSPVPPP